MIYFFLPDTPANARFLSQQDRVKAITRVAENKTGMKDSIWRLPQAIEATLDIKIWLLVIIQVATNVANGGVQSVSIIPPYQDQRAEKLADHRAKRSSPPS